MVNNIFVTLQLHYGNHYRMPMEEFTMLIIATCAHNGRDPRQALHRIPQHHRWPGIGRECIISTRCVVPLLREEEAIIIAQYVCVCVCVSACVSVCVYIRFLSVSVYISVCSTICVCVYICQGMEPSTFEST